MVYRGSCHCGLIAFEVEGLLAQVTACNCSICSRKGALFWFVPRDSLRLLTPEENIGTYSFGRQTIRHRFCPHCGVHTYAEGEDATGNPSAAVNARCLKGVELSALPVIEFDGRAL